LLQRHGLREDAAGVAALNPLDKPGDGRVLGESHRHFPSGFEGARGPQAKSPGRNVENLRSDPARRAFEDHCPADIDACVARPPFAPLKPALSFHRPPLCAAVSIAAFDPAGGYLVLINSLRAEQSRLPADLPAMAWTREPTYEKPDISVRATTLYYEIVAPIMLPSLDRRLLNLFRCREGKCFFQRNREHPPTGKEFDRLVHLEPVTQKNGRIEQYLYVQSAQEIVACAKVQTVEFHGWGSRAGSIEAPDRLVIDLDPDPRLGFDNVKDAAFQVQRSFEALALESFALLSGGKGIHVIVPLEPLAEWDEVRDFAKTFCTALAEASPERFTVALPKAQRRGRIFLDFLRNQRTATAILPYSARARPGMPVAAPVTWDELREIDRSDTFTIPDVEALLKRARSRGLKNWGSGAQRLPRLR
jgi:bifunctional non-homologous end joining protein LigD